MGFRNSNRHAKRKAQTIPAPGVVPLVKLSRQEHREPTTRPDRSAERRSPLAYIPGSHGHCLADADVATMRKARPKPGLDGVPNGV